MGTVTNSLVQNNGSSNQPVWFKLMGIVTNSLIQNNVRLLVTVPIIFNQAVDHHSYHFGSGCWLMYRWFWIRLLVTVPIILDQDVGYCSHCFGLDSWLLFTLFWMRLLVTIPINLNHTGWLLLPLFLTAWSKIMWIVTESLIQNNENSNQQHGQK
jgi:hypothetical protein